MQSVLSKMEAPRDRSSETPLAMDVAPRRARQPRRVLGFTLTPALENAAGYIGAGAFFGLAILLVLRRDPSSASSTEAMTDPVTHLHAREIDPACWRGMTKGGPARLTVTLEVGLDGRVRHATAAGETAALRGCVEAHVRAWEFLPQRAPHTMSLPFEVDRR